MRTRAIETRSFKVANSGYIHDAEVWKVPGGAVFVLSRGETIEYEFEGDTQLEYGTLLAYNGETGVWSTLDNIFDAATSCAHAVHGYGWWTMLPEGECDQLMKAMERLGENHERILSGVHLEPVELARVISALGALDLSFERARDHEKSHAHRRFKRAGELLDDLERRPNPGAAAATLVGARNNLLRRIDDSRLKEAGLSQREIGLMRVIHESQAQFRTHAGTLETLINHVETHAKSWWNAGTPTQDAENFARRLEREAREIYEARFPRPFTRHQRHGVTNLHYAAACIRERAFAPGLSLKTHNARDVLVTFLNGIRHMALRQEIEHVRRALLNGTTSPSTMAGMIGSLLGMTKELQDSGFVNPVRDQVAKMLAGGFIPALAGDVAATRQVLKSAAAPL